MSLSRRHLFGLLGGAALAPLLPEAAPAADYIIRSRTTFYPNEMLFTPTDYCRMANEALQSVGQDFQKDFERRLFEAYRPA